MHNLGKGGVVVIEQTQGLLRFYILVKLRILSDQGSRCTHSRMWKSRLSRGSRPHETPWCGSSR